MRGNEEKARGVRWKEEMKGEGRKSSRGRREMKGGEGKRGAGEGERGEEGG